MSAQQLELDQELLGSQVLLCVVPKVLKNTAGIFTSNIRTPTQSVLIQTVLGTPCTSQTACHAAFGAWGKNCSVCCIELIGQLRPASCWQLNV